METKKPRILICATNYFPFVGGAEVAVKEIASRLREDFDFDMIVPKVSSDTSRHETIENINVYRVGGGGNMAKFMMPFTGLWKARQLNKKNPYAGVWSIMASQASIAAAFFKILHPDKKLILTLQEGDEEEHLKRYVGGITFLYKIFIRPWHLLVFKKADQITAISTYLKNRAEVAGVRAPISIIPNAVDVAHFSERYLPKDLAELKDALGKKHDDIFLVTTGRLVEKNAVEDIVSALAHLPSNVRFLNIGTGALQEKLRIQIEKLGLTERVLSVGFISHERLPQYLQVSDIFVRPSLSEGMGNSFIEAMVVGLPVIATPVGGITDFIFDPEQNPEHEPTGLFCTVKDPQSIAQAVIRLIYDSDLKHKLVSNARKLAISKYDWDIIAGDFKALFSGLLK